MIYFHSKWSWVKKVVTLVENSWDFFEFAQFCKKVPTFIFSQLEIRNLDQIRTSINPKSIFSWNSIAQKRDKIFDKFCPSFIGQNFVQYFVCFLGDAVSKKLLLRFIRDCIWSFYLPNEKSVISVLYFQKRPKVGIDFWYHPGFFFISGESYSHICPPQHWTVGAV